jgi:hypothetical protein
MTMMRCSTGDRGEIGFVGIPQALTRLDTQTTEAFLAVFASIRDWEKRMSEFLDPNVFFDPETEQAVKSEFDFFYAKAKAAVESAESMQAILQDNEIFFTKDLYGRISKFFLEATAGIGGMMEIIETTKIFENPIPEGMQDWG